MILTCDSIQLSPYSLQGTGLYLNCWHALGTETMCCVLTMTGHSCDLDGREHVD